MLDRDIVESRLELESRYYVRTRTDTHVKGIASYLPPID